jgi:monofunctional biosynthetic peptidoglycan transglycosylase
MPLEYVRSTPTAVAIPSAVAVECLPAGRPLSWRHLWRHLAQTRVLANRNPSHTGFTRYRAGSPDPITSGNWRALREISPFLICAIVHAEDPTFFRHSGFWWEEIQRQISRARKLGTRVRGVSTITQQLARNLFLIPERTLRRKTQEAIIAIQLERVLSKLRILELYINVIEWGADVWGAEMAAQAYFQSSASQLGPFASVFLASLLPAPRGPLRGANAQRAIRAQRRLTALLYGSGIISLTQERDTYRTIAALERCILDGADVGRFLGAVTVEQKNAVAETRYDVADVLALECGFVQRCQYEYFTRTQSLYTRGIATWPAWWSVDAAREILR